MTVGGADSEEQSDELLALSGILDTAAFSHSVSECGGHKGVLEVEGRVPGDGVLQIIRGQGKPSFTVKYLPPVRLEFSLPPDYPSLSCPLYCITCPWLLEDQKKKVEDELKNLWDQQGGGVILFTWLNFLQEELLEFLGLDNRIDISAFTDKTSSVHEEPRITATDNLKLIDDDEARTIDKSDTSNHVSEAESVSDVVETGASDKGPVQCTVLQWSVSQQIGVLDTGRGEALVRHCSIDGHNIAKLEASLEVGEQVECRLVEKESNWEGVGRKLEAFNVTGFGGCMVMGNKKVENVKVLEEDVMGSVVRWSNRGRDGTLRGHKGDVYVYYTCVQGEGSLCKGDRVVFHVVESQKWGVLASFVRKWEDGGREKEEEMELDRMRRERDKREHGTGADKNMELTGWVKKWKDELGKGIIRGEGGKEWSFTSKDCRVKGEPGFKLFSKGVKVSFVQISDNHGATPRAGQVRWMGEDDSGVCSSSSGSLDLPAVVKPVDEGLEREKALDNAGEAEKKSRGGAEELSVCPVPPETSSSKQENDIRDDPVIHKRVRRHSRQQQQLATLLREFNNMKEEEEFAVSLNSCLICFTDKIGSQCLRFVVCSHVYCRDCMTNYFIEKISTGAVSSLVCPTPKCDTQALPNQVAELVTPDLFQKYESLLLETQLESMTDVMSCPRVVCQCPTMIDRETNMGQCPACQLAFCIYCKATYHGVSPCKFKSAEQRTILERYKNSTGEERIFLEKRYGKKQLATMSATLASEDYMASHARQCPHCNAPIEKNEGCNKITCWRCNTNFCWLCGLKLPQANPYTHFNVQGGKCYGALFQGVDPLDGDDEFDDLFDEEDDWEEVQAAIFGV
eukprot:GFUD01035727.1.p1 GENE.GFUD01035727.1~~GFUD01035727.1.p1  ORF type:complete len:851 (+),score=264.61 GFUD01035727.1:38-2590(+)